MVHHLVAALIVQGERILLGKRSPERAFWPNVWDVFGGHIEPDEQPEQALVRELQEELGISLKQWVELGILREAVPEQNDTPVEDFVVYFYCATVWKGTPTNRQPHEHSIIEWFSYAEAIKLDLAHPSYPRLFAQCLQMLTASEE